MGFSLRRECKISGTCVDVLSEFGSATKPEFTKVEYGAAGHPFFGLLDAAGATVKYPAADFGFCFSVTFVDLNMDGVFDMYCGTRDGANQLYKNVGSKFAPKFQRNTARDLGMRGCGGDIDASDPNSALAMETVPLSAALVFEDLDLDGDLDLLIGTAAVNTGGTGKLVDTDWDGDGQVDGKCPPKATHRANVGSAVLPIFALTDDANHPLDIIGINTATGKAWGQVKDHLFRALGL